MIQEPSGKPDAGKLARPVWGWGQGETPWPTPHPHRGIVDLKTCDDLTWFEADAKRYGYVHQLAFYRAVLAQVIAVLMPVFLIAVEKKEPFRCGVWKINDDTLLQACRENEAAIERLQRCEATDAWPTGYEECRVFDAIC